MTWHPTWAVRLIWHPKWALRKLRNRLGCTWRMHRGKPGWIVKPGWITACPHNHALIYGLHVNTYSPDWTGPLTADELLDRVVLAYPDCVLHEPLPDQCALCAHQEDPA